MIIAYQKTLSDYASEYTQRQRKMLCVQCYTTIFCVHVRLRGRAASRVCLHVWLTIYLVGQ